MLSRRAFTLIELVAVLVVLAILAGVALPRYLNRGNEAKESADEHVLAAINTALIQRYTNNRVNDAPSGQWITQMAQVPAVLQFDALPSGTRINGTEFIDQRGNRYVLTPETATSAARIGVAPSDLGGGDEDDSGAGDVPPVMLGVCLLPWMGRERRRERKA